MSIFSKIAERDGSLSLIPQVNKEYDTFLQKDIRERWGSNPDTLTLEEGMFLYSMVLMLKPKNILETGTNLALATRFMALALEDSRHDGRLTTIEHDTTVASIAGEKLLPYPNVVLLCGDVMEFNTKEKYDFVFLGS